MHVCTCVCLYVCEFVRLCMCTYTLMPLKCIHRSQTTLAFTAALAEANSEFREVYGDGGSDRLSGTLTHKVRTMHNVSSAYRDLRVHLLTYAQTSTHAYTPTRVHHVFDDTHACACMHLYLFMYTYLSVSIYTAPRIAIRACACTHMHIHTH